MSRKNKTLRAFLHQNKSPTIEQAWDAAWKHAQKIFHARSMRDMEKQVADLQAENERLHEQLRLATVDQAIAEAEASDAHAENKRLVEALEDIRSRSSMNLAMNPNPFELTAMLGDIHQIAGAALAEESSND